MTRTAEDRERLVQEHGVVFRPDGYRHGKAMWYAESRLNPSPTVVKHSANNYTSPEDAIDAVLDALGSP